MAALPAVRESQGGTTLTVVEGAVVQPDGEQGDEKIAPAGEPRGCVFLVGGRPWWSLPCCSRHISSSFCCWSCGSCCALLLPAGLFGPSICDVCNVH